MRPRGQLPISQHYYLLVIPQWPPDELGACRCSCCDTYKYLQSLWHGLCLFNTTSALLLSKKMNFLAAGRVVGQEQK
jgi:hypothetical protein